MTLPATATVVGGTGFLGTTIVDRLCRAGVDVTVVSRTASVCRDRRHLAADLFHTSADEWADLLAGSEAVVVAAGADERHTVRGNAAEYFESANVDSLARLGEGALRAGVGRIVVLGSIFSAHAQDGVFAADNPYLRSRLRQEELLAELAAKGLVTTVVRVAMAFGPGADDLWSGLIRYCGLPGPVPTIRGAVPACSGDSVAEAVVTDLSRSSSDFRRVPVVDTSLRHTELMRTIREELGRRDKLLVIPDQLFTGLMRVSDAMSHLTRRPAPMSRRELGRFLLTEHLAPVEGEAATVGRDRTLRAIREMTREIRPTR